MSKHGLGQTLAPCRNNLKSSCGAQRAQRRIFTSCWDHTEVRHQRSKKSSPHVSAQCQETPAMLRTAEGPKPGYGAQRAPERNARTGTQRVPGRSVNLLPNVVTECAGESRAPRRGLRKCSLPLEPAFTTSPNTVVKPSSNCGINGHWQNRVSGGNRGRLQDDVYI